ncbi:uncharacterized protein LOC104651987 [Saimiri boliviensis]|uniref:uncharacterized protein LOC104651987 n=1 Tax=Saimiri boliviensis TaxID=27679 RepID=UPI000533E6D8|nr:sal-like protein 2 [Saimiri boliviensis boliviensis]
MRGPWGRSCARVSASAPSPCWDSQRSPLGPERPERVRGGDSTTRSRVEELRETGTRGGSTGVIPDSWRCGARPLRSGPAPPGPPPPPLRNAARAGEEALQPQCRGLALRGRERLREKEALRGSPGPDRSAPFLSSSFPPPPSNEDRVQIWTLVRRRWRVGGSAPRNLSLGGDWLRRPAGAAFPFYCPLRRAFPPRLKSSVVSQSEEGKLRHREALERKAGIHPDQPQLSKNWNQSCQMANYLLL